MNEAYIVRRGGGSKLFAAIGVTYPAGSTVTCTNGTKTLKAKTTTGRWVFAIPEAGTWTVTSTDGTNTKSQSVSITAEGQFESVALSYSLVLFDNGDKIEVSGGWTGGGHAWGHATGSNNGNYGNLSVDTSITWNGGKDSTCPGRMWFAVANNKISVDKYDALKVNFTKIPTSPIVARVVLRSSNALIDVANPNDAVVASIDATAIGETSLPISDITGSYYIGFVFWAPNTGHVVQSATANKVWLE